MADALTDLRALTRSRLPATELSCMILSSVGAWPSEDRDGRRGWRHGSVWRFGQCCGGNRHSAPIASAYIVYTVPCRGLKVNGIAVASLRKLPPSIRVKVPWRQFIGSRWRGSKPDDEFWRSLDVPPDSKGLCQFGAHA